MSERVYLSPPDVGASERELLLDAFDSNWIAPLGPHVDAFEAEMATVSDRKYAVATNSGTAALHLALRYMGVGRGSRVVTSSLTFAATANAIRYLDAQPVFLDSCADSWNMDPAILAELLSRDAASGSLPAAVVPVDLYGQCADYERISTICAQYEVPVIFDAAESLGAKRGVLPAGAAGQAAIFSFNGNKIITTSGGGMLVTDNRQMADKTRFWSTQAKDDGPHYQHSELGYNYRLSNLLAALGRGQLLSLQQKVDRRREHNRHYRRALAEFKGLVFLKEDPMSRATFWLTTLTVDPKLSGVHRDGLISALNERNIEARPVWKPMHLQPLYRGAEAHGGAVSEELFRNGICLPSGSSMSDDVRERVCETLCETLRVFAF